MMEQFDDKLKKFNPTFRSLLREVKFMQNLSRRALWDGGLTIVVLVAVALLTALTISSVSRNGSRQDTLRLESRINQLEQRLYTIETSLRNLEQQTRFGSGASRGAGQDELLRLRSEIQTLQRRVADDECGLAKLDERTLTRETRETRRRSGANRSDPCRSQVDAPLALPDRP